MMQKTETFFSLSLGPILCARLMVQDKDDKKSKKSVPRSAPTQLVYNFKKTLKASRKLRDSLDMTEYQLVEMHDR